MLTAALPGRGTSSRRGPTADTRQVSTSLLLPPSSSQARGAWLILPAGSLQASLGFGFRGRLPASGATGLHLCSRIVLSHHSTTWFDRINFPSSSIAPSSLDHPGSTRSSFVSHLKPTFFHPTPPSMHCLTSQTPINSCRHLVSLLLPSHLSTST